MNTSAFASLAADHPLAQWIEVFSAGMQTDSKGRGHTFTEADLDAMVANHAAQAAPAVIGHPLTNDPAMGWVDGLKREGGKLLAKFKDWNAGFVAAVDAGGYRNRSISVSKGAAGYQINHVGWLGAKLPAVAGMAALAYAAQDDAFEFSAGEMFTALALEDVADILNGLRDAAIERDGLEAADKQMPAWRIKGVREMAQRLRELEDDKPGNSPLSPPSPYSAGATPMSFTQDDLDRAATEARAAAKAEATAEFAAAANDTAAELAALKAQAARDKHAASMDAWMREGRLLPAERGGMAEFMAALDAQPATFDFSTGEGDAKTDMATTQAAWFANFMAKRPQLIKLGVREDAGEAGSAADYAGADGGAQLAFDAQTYMAGQKAKGIEMDISTAIADCKAGKYKPAA